MLEHGTNRATSTNLRVDTLEPLGQGSCVLLTGLRASRESGCQRSSMTTENGVMFAMCLRVIFAIRLA